MSQPKQWPTERQRRMNRPETRAVRIELATYMWVAIDALAAEMDVTREPRAETAEGRLARLFRFMADGIQQGVRREGSHERDAMEGWIDADVVRRAEERYFDWERELEESLSSAGE